MIRPRLPAFSHGFVSLLWGVGLGLYVWLGLAAVGVGTATAFVLGAVAGALIFFFVLLRGDEGFRR